MVPARKLVTLNYGRALKADTRSPGKVPVFGTNGQCGWHDAPLAKAPGLILGMVKRILNKFGYPPDLQEEAVKTVLAQAELLCAEWV